MDAYTIPLETKIDDRGFLHQIYNADLPKPIQRIYIVGNFNQGIIRGMHYHEKEWKFFFTAKGSIKFVVSKDEKPSSKTKTLILSDKKPSMVIIPPKHYNGWIALEENTLLIGISNFTLKDSLEDDKRVSPEIFKEYFKTVPR